MSIRRTTVLIIDLEHDQLRLTLEEAALLVRCNDDLEDLSVDDTTFSPQYDGIDVCVGWNDSATVPRTVVEQVRAELAKEPS